MQRNKLKKKLKNILVGKQVKKLEVEKVIALGIYITLSQEENKKKILIINIIQIKRMKN